MLPSATDKVRPLKVAVRDRIRAAIGLGLPAVCGWQGQILMGHRPGLFAPPFGSDLKLPNRSTRRFE